MWGSAASVLPRRPTETRDRRRHDGTCRGHTRNSSARRAIVAFVRIAIDVRKLHDFGIGTYVRNLVDQLAHLDPRTEYVLLTRRADTDLARRLGPNFHTMVDASGQYSMREQLSIPFHVARAGVQLFHSPHYVLPALTPRRSIVTIHDCIHLLFPQYLRSRVAHGYVRAAFWTAVHRASRILTVSEASKRDILRFFPVPEERVTVIHNAIADRFHQQPPEDEMARVRERYQLQDRFIMYAGNVKPHKNLGRLLDAFMLLRQQRRYDDLKLLITGSEVSRSQALRRAVHRYNLHKHVRFLGFQSEDTLAALYRLAAVFVFPSLYEGFGLPPLEAMASGTPVVVSNVSSLPEVVGDAGVLVNPYDAQSIADGVSHVLEDGAFRAGLVSRGIVRARSFSWRDSARRTRAIYEEVAAHG